MTVKSIVLALVPRELRKYTDQIEASPISYRIAKGVFWSLAGALISRGLTLVSSIIVARIIGREGFGELGVIQNTVGMFGVFAGFGMGMTATKHVAELRESSPQRAGHIISLSSLVSIVTGGLMALGLFVSSPWLAEHTLAASHLSGLLRISALLLFLSSVNGAQTGALAGFESFKGIAKINVLVGVFSFPILILATFFGKVTGAVWGVTITMGLNSILNYAALRTLARENKISLGYSGCFNEWPVLWKFSLPAVFGSAMVGPVNWACSAILVNQVNGYAEMGIFNAANQWRMAILFVPATISRIVLPVLSSLYGENDSCAYKKVIKANIFINAGTGLLIAIVVSLFSVYIMKGYGKTFADGYPVLILLSLSAVLVGVNDVIGQVIASMGKMWDGFMLNILWALILVASCACLISKYLALGLAYAIFIAYVFHSFSQFIYIRHKLR